jgi:Arc/MetJ-type ribon-helix-helix transcriptional regulator
MPAAGKGRVPYEKVNVALPMELYREIESIVGTGRRWMSVVDFIRFACANEVERWKEGHAGSPSAAQRR